MNGAAGHTYGANGIWQCNRPGDPHGKSPHGGTYGIIPWNEAMRLPGSQQVGFGKKLFEEFAWQDFRPHPEWASFSARSGEPSGGEIDGQPNDVNGPQSAGIPGVVHLTYAPRAEPLEVRNLGSGAAYVVRWFDPVTGLTMPLGEIRANDKGRWTCPPPAELTHDWILILESKRSE
jgi:hypothetical protein